MFAMTLQYEVPPARTLVVKLPDSIEPGTHEVVVIVDAAAAKAAPAIQTGGVMRFAGALPSLAGVDGVALQQALREEWQ
jgi:hypothetical protein